MLETCVKNCGNRFHVLLAKKELLDELVKVLNPKSNPPQVVQDKILSLIQDWADAFRGSPDLTYVLETYESLRAQGVEFPAKNLDTLSPIYTPQRVRSAISLIKINKENSFNFILMQLYQRQVSSPFPMSFHMLRSAVNYWSNVMCLFCHRK